jgi:hypothetical protein
MIATAIRRPFIAKTTWAIRRRRRGRAASDERITTQPQIGFEACFEQAFCTAKPGSFRAPGAPAPKIRARATSAIEAQALPVLAEKMSQEKSGNAGQSRQYFDRRIDDFKEKFKLSL